MNPTTRLVPQPRRLRDVELHDVLSDDGERVGSVRVDWSQDRPGWTAYVAGGHEVAWVSAEEPNAFGKAVDAVVAARERRCASGTPK